MVLFSWLRWDSVMPTASMVLLQMGYAGMSVLYKLAIDAGMSLRVLVAYRFIFAAAFLCPLALFMERQSLRKITWMVALQAFCCGLCGATLSQNFYVASIMWTSSTFMSAMSNLLPAVTFILAVFCGLERLAIRTLSSQAKVLGTLICVGGAMLLTFYKGVKIQFWSSPINLLRRAGAGASPEESDNHALASLTAIAFNFSYAISSIIQAKMSVKFPYPYASTALMCLMASVQSVGVAFVTDRDPSDWRLGWDVKLLAVVYSGVLISGLTTSLMSWVIQKKGPLFVSVFNPLVLVIVALFGSIFLDEILRLGSLLGCVLIVLGLYVVLWGKNKQMQKLVKLPSKSSEAGAVPVHPEVTSPPVDEKVCDHDDQEAPVHPEATSPPVAEKVCDHDDQETPKSSHTEIV